MSAIKNMVNASSKTFTHRQSLLTEIFSKENSKIVYNIFICTIIFFIASSTLEEFSNTGTVQWSILSEDSTLMYLHYGIILWAIIFLLSLLCHPVFNLWANAYVKILQISPNLGKLFNFACINVIFWYYTLLMVVPAVSILYFDLPILLSFILLCEQIRMIMKIHSYFRINVPKILKYKVKNPYPQIGSFSSYLYFYFAPTLIYQDEYPRTDKINWKFVLKCVVEILASGALINFILKRYNAEFSDTCIEQKSLSKILLFIYQNSPLAFLFKFAAGFILLHCWSNTFAEILRFGDRLFYKDWWNTPSYLQYYRLWNDVVQDWLYAFVYKDFLYFFPGWKNSAKIMVFFVSAVFHEYILILALRIFFPINFCMFFFASIVMIHLKTNPGNVFFLATMGVGFSTNIAAYMMEWYASKNYLHENESLLDYLIPVFYKCNAVDLS